VFFSNHRRVFIAATRRPVPGAGLEAYNCIHLKRIGAAFAQIGTELAEIWQKNQNREDRTMKHHHVFMLVVTLGLFVVLGCAREPETTKTTEAPETMETKGTTPTTETTETTGMTETPETDYSIKSSLEDVKEDAKDMSKELKNVAKVADAKMEEAFRKNLQQLDAKMDAMSAKMERLGDKASAELAESWKAVEEQRVGIAEKIESAGEDAKQFSAELLEHLEAQLNKLAESVGDTADRLSEEEAEEPAS